MSHDRRHPVPPTTLTTRKVRSADGTPLHVEVHGPSDAPTVVLAHGWTCSTRFWAAQVAALSRELRVVVYDQRGHGRTPLARVGTDVLADDLEAVLRAVLAPGQRAVLGGHSMGAMTIMAAADRPAVAEHAAAVLLCSTGASHLIEEARVFPLRRGPLRSRLTLAVLGSSAPLGPVNPLSKRLLQYATMGRAASRTQVGECARIVHACPRATRVAWGGVLAALDLTDGVRGLAAPTVVVAGAADKLSPPVHAHRIAAHLPDCRELVLLPGAGHMTPVEAPDAVTAKLRELVAVHLAEETTADVTEEAAEDAAEDATEKAGEAA
ncbi:alpha/beta hydrolase [Streptomyces sp. NPDC047315]|uniref:alpha/beta fold hydrolase n=1 Tax=Streptomyces sp. NPDC047315 TaxID=3155142 RepID=UPI0033F17307